jgi:muconolactone delta-isomerase
VARAAGAVAPAVAAIALFLASAGCGGALSYVEAEANHWGAFTKVLDGALAQGVSALPAPVREHHCYRVILATTSTVVPGLRFRGEIDSDSVGFPLMAIERRGGEQGGAVAVYGFCSAGTGTIQLQANLGAAGHGALYEAPYASLDPAQGPDVAAVREWLGRREREEASRRATEAEAQRRAAMEEFARTAGPELQGRLQSLLRRTGRYSTSTLDEVRSVPEMREALVLEPGLCYVFAILPYENTEVLVDVLFARIRNATERADLEGAITYSVCTAPSGPVQECSFNVRARVPPDSPTPPTFAVAVSSRPASSTERRAADREWVANDPEARITR